LQVSASTKLSEIDEREGKELEAQVTTLFGLKAQQEAFELILPGKGAFHGEAQFVQHIIKKALSSPFGRLPVARILFDVGLQPGIEDALAVGFTVKARIQIEDGTGEIEPYVAGDPLEGFEPLGQQHHVHLVYRRHRQRGQDVSVSVDNR
jgi:hypothetical protein